MSYYTINCLNFNVFLGYEYLMEDFSKYIDILINSCKTSIEQMTRIKVHSFDKRSILKQQGPLPFAHIISYIDHDKKIDGEFVLGFESVHDALKLASGIAERLGIGVFDKICEDSTDLLNEFLNIVVGRTISEWDSLGLSVKFDTPVFKKDYQSKDSKHLKGYIISMDIDSNIANLDEEISVDQILLRVNFAEKIKNKIEKKTILLAEDSNVMRKIIAKMLIEHGAKVIEAKDGTEAVKLHKKHHPDLALMDINMPKMDGFEAISKIREFNSDAKFVILSSSSRKDEIITAKTLNVSGYLVKPFDQEKLIERISAIL
jgi:two-component system, chemotaxis family, chemotaxis protein CheY